MRVGALLLVAGAIFSTTVIAPTASGQERSLHWNCRIDTGDCIGKVRMTVRQAFWKDAIGEYVLSSFPNKEYLFEDSTTNDAKKIFHLAKADRYVFYGVRGQGAADNFRNRYQQGAGRAIFVVMINMIGAFPEGEDAMPQEWETRKLQSQGEGGEFDVSAKKSGPNRFLFKVKSARWDVEGEWDVAKSSAWLDDTQMDGWTISGTTPAPSLGVLRKGTR